MGLLLFGGSFVAGIRSLDTLYPLCGTRFRKLCLLRSSDDSLTHCQTLGSCPPFHPKIKPPKWRFNFWWVGRDSNPGPKRYERSALTN